MKQKLHDWFRFVFNADIFEHESGVDGEDFSLFFGLTSLYKQPVNMLLCFDLQSKGSILIISILRNLRIHVPANEGTKACAR